MNNNTNPTTPDATPIETIEAWIEGTTEEDTAVVMNFLEAIDPKATWSGYIYGVLAHFS